MDLKCTNAFLDVIEMHQTFCLPNLPNYLSLLKMSMHVSRHPPQNVFPCKGVGQSCHGRVQCAYQWQIPLRTSDCAGLTLALAHLSTPKGVLLVPYGKPMMKVFLSYRTLQRSMSLLFESIKLSPNSP